MKKALTILAAAAMIAVSASPAYAYGIDCRPNVKCVGDAKGNVMFGSGGQDIMRGLGGAGGLPIRKQERPMRHLRVTYPHNLTQRTGRFPRRYAARGNGPRKERPGRVRLSRFAPILRPLHPPGHGGFFRMIPRH
jgi:hypothetical protein